MENYRRCFGKTERLIAPCIYVLPAYLKKVKIQSHSGAAIKFKNLFEVKPATLWNSSVLRALRSQGAFFARSFRTVFSDPGELNSNVSGPSTFPPTLLRKLTSYLFFLQFRVYFEMIFVDFWVSTSFIWKISCYFYSERQAAQVCSYLFYIEVK